MRQISSNTMLRLFWLTFAKAILLYIQYELYLIGLVESRDFAFMLLKYSMVTTLH